MASLSTDANGNRTIQFIAADDRRRSVRLGKVPKRFAEGVKLRVETLAAMLPPDTETAAWTAGIGDDLHTKLAAAGLTPERRSERHGAFLDAYIIRCRQGANGGT